MTTGTITLETTLRDRTKSAKNLRKEGRVPGVLYGFDTKNTVIECGSQALHKAFLHAGESTIIELKVGGKTVPVLIHDMHFDPITGAYAHVDFYAVNMKKEVTAHVPIRPIGEALGVKELGGVLVQNRETITVKCLPKDLPHAIEVDISPLKNFFDTITLAQVSLPPAVKVEEKPEEILFTIQPPRKEEEITPAPALEGEVAAGEGAEPVEGEEAKKEGKEGEEKGGNVQDQKKQEPKKHEQKK